MVTVIDDREGDIYEKWARLPDERTHLLTRASRDRSLADGGKLFASLAQLPEAHRFTLELPARPEQARCLERLKWPYASDVFASVALASALIAMRPARLGLFAIEVRELGPPPDDEICWRLLTTHPVESIEQALTVIGWYRLRWHIEQLFRTLKRQGLGIEQSVVEDGEALEKLVIIALIAAVTTMQLVLARSTSQPDQPASRVFDPNQIEVLHALQNKLQGRTAKQQNPHPPDTLCWASWIVARLGGWTGYDAATNPRADLHARRA